MLFKVSSMSQKMQNIFFSNRNGGYFIVLYNLINSELLRVFFWTWCIRLGEKYLLANQFVMKYSNIIRFSPNLLIMGLGISPAWYWVGGRPPGG